MKKIIFSIALLFLGYVSFGQYLDADVLRLTQNTLNGNARYVGMGGAFSALGGNFSALSVNPAAIGVYKRGEFTFTPSLSRGQTQTQHLDGRWRDADRWNFNFSNAGLVFVINQAKSEKKNELKGIQFGFGINRQNNFWNEARLQGNVLAGDSYLEILTEEANVTGNLDNDYYRGLAYDAGLIFFDSVRNLYGNDLSVVQGELAQKQLIRSSGGTTEMVFSAGANYGDFLYFGATIGVPFYNYRQTKTLTESDELGLQDDFHSWSFREDLDVSGHGVNLKVGVIVRPVDFLRIGFAVHTPTFYNLTETFETSITGNTSFVDPNRRSTKSSIYDYVARSPMRLIGSLGVVIAKHALFSVEYEHVNYRNMRLDDDYGSYDIDNDYIEDSYRSGGTLRTGLELRFHPISFRLGYNYGVSPYGNNAPDYAWSQHTFTGGLGFQFGSVNLDLAYANRFTQRRDWMYYSLPYTQYKEVDHQFILSLGFRF